MSTDAIYFVRIGQSGEQIGPIDVSQLRGLARQGKIGKGDFIRRMPSQSWTPASNVKGLLPAIDDSGAAFDAGPWYVRAGDRKGGPYSIDKIRVLAQRGVLTAEALASVDGKDWKPAGHIPGAFDDRGAGSSVIPRPAAGAGNREIRGAIREVESAAPVEAGMAVPVAAAAGSPRAAPGFVGTMIRRSPRAFRVLIALVLIVFLVAAVSGALISASKWDGESRSGRDSRTPAAGRADDASRSRGDSVVDGDQDLSKSGMDESRSNASGVAGRAGTKRESEEVARFGSRAVAVDPDHTEGGRPVALAASSVSNLVRDDAATNIDALVSCPDPRSALDGVSINSSDKGMLEIDGNNLIVNGEQNFPRNTNPTISADRQIRGFQVANGQRIVRVDCSAKAGGVRIFPDGNDWLREAALDAHSVRVALSDSDGAKYFALGLIEDDGDWVLVRSMGGRPFTLKDIPMQHRGIGKSLSLHFGVPEGAKLTGLLLVTPTEDRLVNTISVPVRKKV